MKCELLLSHPFFKRRYAVATDMLAGCRIGCEFCYYRWTPLAPHFRPGASLLPLCSPRDYWNVLLESKLIRPGDIILFCARSDFSMPENRAAFSEFLEKYFDPSRKPLRFLLLQRPPWRKEDWERFREHPVIFGTTITPRAFQKGFNSVRDDAQIRGLVELREAGCPPERISLELGPILPDTAGAAVEIARTLYFSGVITFLVYRGSSLGPGDHTKLREKGFWSEFRPYTYFDGKEERPHKYYRLKNYIPPETEKRFLEGVEGTGLRVYRHTGHLYAREFGARMAVTRNNRLREDMVHYARPLSRGEVRARLEEVFGIQCEIEEISSILFRLHRVGTEDIAHAIGAELGVGILFTEFSNDPLPEMYFREGWLIPV